MQLTQWVVHSDNTWQNQSESQTALVMLNKGDRAAKVKADMVSAGEWVDAISGKTVNVAAGESTLTAEVPAHGVAVWIFEGSVSNAKLNTLLVEHQSKLKI